MWTVNLAEDSQEKSILIFYENYKKKCHLLQFMLGWSWRPLQYLEVPKQFLGDSDLWTSLNAGTDSLNSPWKYVVRIL